MPLARSTTEPTDAAAVSPARLDAPRVLGADSVHGSPRQQRHWSATTRRQQLALAAELGGGLLATGRLVTVLGPGGAVTMSEPGSTRS